MNHYLIDHTREYLTAGAAYAQTKWSEVMTVEVVAQEANVLIRCGTGAERKLWAIEICDWDVLATAKENPLLAIIDQVIFRVQRAAENLTLPPIPAKEVGDDSGG